MKKTTLALAALAASFICAAAGAETRSADIRLEKPLLSAHLSFSGNIRRFDVKLEKPMDLSSAAGVSFQVKCADPQVLTDCWLLFKTGHGYYRASFPVPAQAGTWTDAVVLKENVRLYHWNSHISLYEVQLRPAQEDVPDWSRVTELQVVFSLEIDRTTADGSVAVRDFAPLAAESPQVAAARVAERESLEKMMSVVRAQPSVPRGRRFLATHVWGLGWNWDETCRMLKEGGITDVIPLMTYAGYAYYRGSKFEPPSPLMDEHGDGLRLCQAACRKYGLSCHPWRASWRMSQHTPKERVEELRKAGRLQVAFEGSSQYWFCPTHPENVQREIEGILELAQFGVRGIMLDYFRFPSKDYCFCPRCRKLFEAKVGHAVEPWPGAVRQDAALAAEWSSFRRETLTGVLRTIRRELRRLAPELELSAAVAATPRGGEGRGQDWPQWCRENLLDRMFPMCYYSTSKLLRHDVEVQAEVMKGSSTKLCPMTCFACGDIPFLKLDEICRQIEVVRSFGFEDLGFFRLTEYAPHVLKALRQGPLAALPLVPYPQNVTELGGRVQAPEAVCRRDASLKPEGYRLRVADGKAEIFSSTDAGAFYARQTLAQLKGADGSYPCVEIADAPAFGWRGVLIDESRHFWGKDVVKHVLDKMAAFKLNVFHWHLTDSHGWRIQIDRYPELTDRGARRPIPDWDWNIRDAKDAVGEYGPYFYTKDDIREILAYAKERHIRVIPEIEIPGHSRELILCHPDFSCLDWGRFVDMARTRHEVDQAAALCVGNDDVMTFMENILDEVVELFPDEIVHIGGDECPRGNWKTCAKCQKRMKDENLKSEDELQAWVTRRFSKYLAKKGRKIVGWDEILQGGLPEGAVVMSWRGAAGGIEAAAQGHDAIVCPHQLCYLDYPTGELSDTCEYPRFCRTTYVGLERNYAFDPYEGIPTNQWKHVLGSQTLNWGESTWDEKSLEYKMWPRTCANAEIVWTGPKKRTFADFRSRLEPIARRMAAAGVNVSLDPFRGRGAYEGLAPVPQVIQYRPATVLLAALEKVTVKTGKVPGAPESVAAESYVLDVSADGVVVTAPTEKGVRRAKETLARLRKLAAGTECVLSARITDWPSR